MRLRTLLLAPLLMLPLLLGSCANLRYYGQAINGQVELLNLARPIDSVIGDPATKPQVKDKLAKVREMREFASRELGLPNNASYRNYADLQRPYVVWNVFATPELSVTPRTWCFVLAGCVGYRGYFAKDAAERYADELRAQGYDVYVAGIPAYSTLGWLNDPILNTFIGYPDAEIARLIFHELAHQIAYVADDSTFNESFAVAVEEEGIRRWFARNASPEQQEAYRVAQERKSAFFALIKTYRDKLKALYASSRSDQEKRAEKARIIADMRQAYAALKETWGGYAGYDRWFGQPLNNAQLASVSMYTQLLPSFRALLAENMGNLTMFYKSVQELARLDKDRRQPLLQALGAHNVQARAAGTPEVETRAPAN